MKKVIVLIAVLLSVKSFSQDSVKITISLQARDLEYIADNRLLREDVLEDLWDSLKVKFRVQIPPTGNTTVPITATTGEWFLVLLPLKKDYVAILNNCASRVETVLRALNNSYINSKLDAIDADINSEFSSRRQAGRDRLKRKS